MTDDTTYREKGRALILAALMVLSVVAMAASFSGAVVADDHDVEDYDEGNRYWQGQVINITEQNASDMGGGDEFAVINNDSGELEREYANDSGFEIETDDLETGDYDIEDASGDVVGSFRIATQSLDAEFEESSVGQQDNATLTLDSERNGYDLQVSADGLDNETLNDTFAGDFGEDNINDTADEDEEYIILEDVDSVAEIELDTSKLETDNYTFDFEARDTTAEASANLEVTEQNDELDFADGDVIEQRSNTAEIVVNLENTDEAHLRVGNYDQVGYEANMTLVDEDEDGEVVVEFNTSAYEDESDLEDAYEAAGDEDEVNDVEIHDDVDLSAPLEAADYEMSLATSDDFEDDEQATQYLTLEEREPISEDALTVWTAPEDTDDFEDATLTESSNIADEDKLYVSLETEGLFSQIEEENFDDLDNGLELNVTEQDSRANSDPTEWSTANTDDDELNGSIVSANQSEGQVIFAIDYEDTDGLEAGEFEEANGYDIDFTVTEDNDYVDDEDDEESASSEFTLEERNIEWADSATEVPANEEATVEGETNVAPGTEIDTRARASGEFSTSMETEVEAGDEGTNVFAATYDFSEYSEGIEFTLNAQAPGQNLDDENVEHEIDAILTKGDDTSEPETDITVEGDAPSEVNVDDDATLDVTITNNADEEMTVNYSALIGGEDVSEKGELTIGAGEEVTESHEFDTSEAGDIEWEVTAGDGSDSGMLTVAEEEEPSDDTGDSDGDDSSSDSDGDDSSSDSDGESDSDGDDGTPGFGVGVALVALLAAAMLALRRQN